MKMKKLLAIFLSTVLLLSLAACGENITPTTDEPYDAPVTENTPKKTSLPFEVGTLEVASGEDVYMWATADELKENANYREDLSELFVDVIADREMCLEMLSPIMLEAYENNALLSPRLETRRECFYRYDEAFFEQKKLVSFTLWSTDILVLEVAHLQSYVDIDGSTKYHAVLNVKTNQMEFGRINRGNIVLEIEKNIDITPENLTVDLVDLRI